MNTIDLTHGTHIDEAEALQVAANLNETSDDGWSYDVRPHRGLFVIVVIDEDGVELGPL